uniref:Uncharacterized protein n=1 Tax=Glossina palpalis gambiensis TaxID=67801 RepID=A0A1B0B1C5_9MUSC
MFKEGLYFNSNDYTNYATNVLCCWMIIRIHLRAYMGFVISVVLLSSLRWAMRDFFYFLTLELLFGLQVVGVFLFAL